MIQGADEVLVSVVIPIYNESRILLNNLERLARFCDETVGLNRWMFILVDNGSTDGTIQLVEKAVKRWPPSRGVFTNIPNIGAAQKAGLSVATTKWIYMVDIEQWDFPFMRWAWRNRNHYDMFLGSKRADPTLNYQHYYRRILSAGLNGVLQVFFGFSGTDTHGPKLLDREALASIITVSSLDRGQFETELVLRATRKSKRLVEMPVEYRESRPHRNFMVQKIIWNLFALRRLNRVMKKVPFEGRVKHYRFTRDEVENTTLIAENMTLAREEDRAVRKIAPELQPESLHV